MASNYIFLHSRRSQPIACLFLFPLYLNHLLPRLSIFHVVFLLSLFLPFYMPKYVLAVRCICILSTWPYYRSQKDFINFKTPSPLNMSFTSLFVFILQRFTSPYIPLTIFRSNIPNAFGFTAVFVQTSWPVRQRPSDTCTQYYKLKSKILLRPVDKNIRHLLPRKTHYYLTNFLHKLRCVMISGDKPLRKCVNYSQYT